MWQHCGDRVKFKFWGVFNAVSFLSVTPAGGRRIYPLYFFAMKIKTNNAGETVGVAYSLCRKCRHMQTKNVIVQQFRDFTLSPIISWRFLVVSVVGSRVSPENVDRSP